MTAHQVDSANSRILGWKATQQDPELALTLEDCPPNKE